jgi:spore maturation protein CgeB
MKVFVTGPDSDDSFGHNVAYTFREMGHDVRTGAGQMFAMLASPVQRALSDLLSRAWRHWRMRGDAQAVRIASEFKPDLTVMCTMTLEPETVERIRRLSGGLVVCWYGDTAGNVRRDHLVSGEYDAVFAKDGDLVHVLREILGLEAHHLPEACNPAWHRPVAQRKGDAVVVAGTAYGYRNALVGRLLEAGERVRLYGPLPPRWATARVRAAHTGTFLDHTRKAQVFGEALACLGSFALSEGRNSVNCRIFETCACGGLLLCEDRDAIAPYFARDREYLAYGSFDECRDHLRRLHEDYAGAQEIRARAAQRAHGQHTYRHRLDRMLTTLELT